MKPNEKVSLMREGGQKLGRILAELIAYAAPGMSLAMIEARAQERIKEAGGVPSFATVPGYKWATCLCVNEVIVHGIPGPYVLKDSDLLTIDIGMIYGGYHTDTADSKIVGTSRDPSVEKFLETGRESLRQAIAQARVGNRIGHISQAMQRVVEAEGYGIVKSLVGHGVGKELHMPPQIPGYLRGTIENTLPLREGMTIALEVIYTMGKPTVEYVNEDGWSIATQDKSLSAVFEHSVAVTDGDPLVLTSP
jgi:methionyl aminopeptidase